MPGTGGAADAGSSNTLAAVKGRVVALAALDTGGGVMGFQNPEAGAIIIIGFQVDITTKSNAACSLDFGVTAVSITTQADNLIDGLDVGTAAGLFDQRDQAGANGKLKQRLAAGAWITGSKDSGAAAGLVGNAYIEYVPV